MTRPLTWYGISYTRVYSTAPTICTFQYSRDPFIRKFVRHKVILTMSIL